MNSRRLPRLARTALTLATSAALLTTTGRTQQASPAWRATVSETSLPGIDRGLRSQGVPRNPGARSAPFLAAAATAEGARPAAGLVAGSVIVKFRDGAETNAVASAMRAVGAAGRQTPSYADFEIVTIPASADPEAVAAELSARPEVEYAQARYVVQAMARPNDPLYPEQWAFPALDMERAWDIQPGATSEIIVAVLDTGVAFANRVVQFRTIPWCFIDAAGRCIPALTYPSLGVINVPFAFAPELGGTRFVTPRDFIWDDDEPFDFDGHGTHVAGTIGQLTNNNVGVAGMAYNVRIMPVKVLDTDWDFIFGNPAVATDDTIARGIRYAADNGAKVINMSLGRPGGGPATVTDAAIRYAVSRGAFVAIAAGNNAEEGNTVNRLGESAPAIDGFVVVAALGRGLTRAFYSTFNSTVELAAPGGDQRRDGFQRGGILQQTLDDDFVTTYTRGPANYRAPQMDVFTFDYFQGTSMATPHVSGFAALLMQQGITTPAAVEAAMKRFARDLGPAGSDPEYGAGLIQPRTALRGLGLAR
jgi:serine protease